MNLYHTVRPYFLLILLCVLPSSVLASSAYLSWAPNSEADLQGYNLYYGTSSRNYASPVPVGKKTNYTLEGLEIGETYYFAITAVDTSGNESGYSSEATKTITETLPTGSAGLMDGISALWLMDEGLGVTVLDSSGNGHTGLMAHNGTSSDPVWQTDASQGTVVALDGAGWSDASAGNYIDLGSLDVSGNQMTIGVMFKASSLDPDDGRLITKQTGVQEQDHYWMLSRYTNNALRFRLRTNGSVSKLVSDANLYSTNEWVLAVATYDGSQMRIYCNGQLVGSLAKSGPIDTNSSIHAFIGAGQDGSNLFTTMDGQVAYAFVYERALSETEIKSIQTGGKSAFGTSSTSTDTTAPLVAITSPVSAETYTTENATIAIAGTASDDHNLQQVTWSSSNGNSGTANGTTNWSISEIPLIEGDNVITVSATDGTGNEASDQLRVTFVPADTKAPTVTIVSPADADVYATNQDTLTLSGKANDDTGLQQVTWTSSNGDSGTAAGNTDWSIDGMSLAEGANVITVTATDSAGNQAADTITVTYTAPAPAANGLSVVSVTSSANDGNVAANTIDDDLSTRWSASGSGQWIQYDLGASFDISQVLIAYYVGDTRIAEFEIFVSNDANSWNSVFKGKSSGTTLKQESYAISNATGRFLRIVGYGNSSNDWNSITEVDIVGVAASSPDATAPTVSILSPASSGNYQTDQATLAVSGSAQDDSGVAEVRWVSSAGQSGTASGTTDWSVSRIALQEGTNTISVTAVDAAGNAGTATLTVTYTAPNTTNPEVAITSPVTTDSYTSQTASISLAGTAGDDRGIAQIAWSTSNGDSGIAVGTTNWSVSGINLADGETVITVEAIDNAGNVSHDTLTVSYTPSDTTAPTVKITSPTTKKSYFSWKPTVNISGLAGDNIGIEKIVWENSSGENGVCEGATNWQASEIPLNRWWNTIKVTAYDKYGNSAQAELTVFRWR